MVENRRPITFSLVLGITALIFAFAGPGAALGQYQPVFEGYRIIITSTGTDCTLTGADAGEDKTTCVGTPVQFDAVQTTGTVKGTLTYSWSPSNGWLSSNTSPQPTVTPTDCGSSSITYTVVVTDDGAASCTAGDQVKLNICCNPGADAGSDQSVCAGESTTLGTCGSSLYSYKWSPPIYLSSTTADMPTASPSTTAPSTSITYTVVVTELGCNSCTSSDRVTLTVCGPDADAGDDQTICAGDTATLGANTNGLVNGAYKYSWSPGTFLDSTTAAHPVASPSSTLPSNTTITYTVVVTATGCNSCTDTAQVKLTVCAKPEEVSAGDDQAVCAGGTAMLGPGELPGGNYKYSWSPPDDLDDPTSPNPTVTTSATAASSSVTYTLVVTELDCNSCTASDQMVLSINENPDCTVTVDAGASDGIVEPGSTHTAWVKMPSAGVKDITWTVVDSGGTDLIVGSNKGITVTFKAPLAPTTIKISVALEDNNGCTCEYDPPLVVPGPSTPAGILKVMRYIPTLAGWGLIGLAALMAGAGAWAVRRRKRN